ncbi:unnamed protein product [Paramecium pentaurelia]|uniref:Uncharacterized protein n=1 Tax=Paramecium pentaurelia TaxID=43138 RepID=A0A8S1Y313_9CILI|nr:unnamed protein product [Paramecium pentaurelia]CAD8207599.1 unnamed protein product [Paramecium pentaurelia]
MKKVILSSIQILFKYSLGIQKYQKNLYQLRQLYSNCVKINNDKNKYQ